MCLTESAPASVQADIVLSLSLTSVVCVKQCLDRPNIHLSVVNKSSFAVKGIIVRYTIA